MLSTLKKQSDTLQTLHNHPAAKDAVITVSNLGKAYRIGLKEQKKETLAATIASAFTKPFKNYRNISNLNKTGSRHSGKDIFWANRNLSFEVERGSVLGIIGKNGAGKSTLLKLLSRITEPTEGRIEITGKVASLLEVGTGFNPELTGRENIYLNGTILGMTKKEVNDKFEQIVEFSGVETFIDTPIKRYSSGMKVRLAFSVAAHLDPEILIIDEVLAVGDVEFQRKCMGKMQEVSSTQGRTILFVSHNLSAISTLCDKVMLLKNGECAYFGDKETGISLYLNENSAHITNEWQGNFGDEHVTIFSTRIYQPGSTNDFDSGKDMMIEIEGEVKKNIRGFICGFTLWSQFDYELAYCLFDDANADEYSTVSSAGKFCHRFCIPANTLSSGMYRLQFDVGIHNVKRIVRNECDLQFQVHNVSGIGRNYLSNDVKGWVSLFRPDWFVGNITQ